MRVLFFALAKDAARVAELDIPITGQKNLDEIWQMLVNLQPRLAAFRSSTRLACNGQYADDKTIFSNEDEVALIPPVSGG